jgi:hypothetical protein
MGKAIISTPFFNELPSPLINRQNIFFVQGELEEIRNAINTIISDTLLREKLESEAHLYFQKIVDPSVALSEIISR